MILKEFNVRPGDFLLIEWDNLTEEILLTTRRTAFLSTAICKIFRKNGKYVLNKFIIISYLYSATKKIVQVLSTLIFEEHKLRLILGNLTITNPQNVERLTTPAPRPYYDVLISVLNPRPSVQTINWDIRSAADSNMI